MLCINSKKLVFALWSKDDEEAYERRMLMLQTEIICRKSVKAGIYVVISFQHNGSFVLVVSLREKQEITDEELQALKEHIGRS
ncbi:hypothetical protein KKG36_02570 [Patescibacteria group bacterium]|nr:hypothetical protein [Patescibacteria group bacterium]